MRRVLPGIERIGPDVTSPLSFPVFFTAAFLSLHAVRAERIVRIEMEKITGALHFEVQWLEEDEAPAKLAAEKITSGVILKTLPDHILYFRLRAILPGGPARWSQPTPIERYVIASMTDEDLLCVVSEGELSFEVRTADRGFELRMISPREVTFVEKQASARGKSMLLKEGSVVGIRTAGETEPRIAIVFSSLYGPDLKIFTLRPTAVELTHSIRVSVFHHLPP